MHRSASSSSVVVTAKVPAADAAHVLPTRDPSANWDQVSHVNGTVDSAEAAQYVIEDRDRIAEGMNEVVVHRIFAAGLDLQAALGMIGEHRAGVKICDAIDELDLAIRDIQSTIFDRDPRLPQSFG